MDGRLKAALTTYLIQAGVKPARLGDIVRVEPYIYHDQGSYSDDEPCDYELEVEIEYDLWTDDATHSLRHIYTIEEGDFEEFLAYLANYRSEGK